MSMYQTRYPIIANPSVFTIQEEDEDTDVLMDMLSKKVSVVSWGNG